MQITSAASALHHGGDSVEIDAGQGGSGSGRRLALRVAVTGFDRQT
jgi:hypothetical protein